MATKLTAEKLASRYAKTTEQLNGIDARKAKAQRTLDSIEGEREELSLKRELLKVQFIGAGGDVSELAADGASESVADDVAEDENDDAEDESDEDDDDFS